MEASFQIWVITLNATLLSISPSWGWGGGALASKCLSLTFSQTIITRASDKGGKVSCPLNFFTREKRSLFKIFCCGYLNFLCPPPPSPHFPTCVGAHDNLTLFKTRTSKLRLASLFPSSLSLSGFCYRL